MRLYPNDLTRGEYHPRVSAYYYKQWVDFRMPFHTHDDVEIMYVISGTCRVDISEASYSLKKGDFMILNANVPHRLVILEGKPCRMLNVEFTFSEQDHSFPSLQEIAAQNEEVAALFAIDEPYLVLRDSVEVYQTLRSLVLEMDDRGRDDNLMARLLLTQLLIHIARLSASSVSLATHQTEMYVKHTMEYIHHHYDCDIQVKDIASAVSLHPGYLHRIFKQLTGQTIMQYLTQFRIDKAKMLLIHTDIPIVEIPEYIGINSRPYFSALFKKHTGCTPRQFRDSAEKKTW